MERTRGKPKKDWSEEEVALVLELILENNFFHLIDGKQHRNAQVSSHST